VLVIDAYTPFVSNSPTGSYTFYNTESITLKLVGSEYVANDIVLLAGSNLSYSFVYSEPQNFVIPNSGVDTDTIKVLVFDSATSMTRSATYTRADSILNVTDESAVYWVNEIENYLYRIRFGDGIIGKKLTFGNMINVRYMISYGSVSNGIRTLAYSGSKSFTYGGSQTMTVNSIVTMVGPSYGGDDPESMESIKFNARRSFNAQQRAVTTDDYKTLILSNFADVKSACVWGGEDNVPVEYGKVFICVSQKNDEKLTQSQRSDITSFLRNRKVVSITPVILDAQYLELILNVTVYYNERETIRTSGDISALVQQKINDYSDNSLDRFDGVFRYSKLTKLIDSSEPSIINSNMTVLAQRELEPRYNSSSSYDLVFITPIRAGTLSTNGFYIESESYVCYLEDDSNGNVVLYYYNDAGVKTVKYSDIGNVDYKNGTVSITGLNIAAIQDDRLLIKFTPNTKDVVSAMNQIVKIADYTITVLPDKTAIGDNRAGFNYQFSS
jgi:hypothetical protein